MVLLDLAMDANPVTLIAAAIAALGVALYEAWEHSSGFRTFIQGLGAGILGMGIVVVEGLKAIVGGVLAFFGSIINGAASAFGWIPGIGPKLKTAAKNFDDFQSGVNSNFNGLIHTLQGWQKGLTDTGKTVGAVTTNILSAFGNQQKAATDASKGIGTLSNAITQNGVNSTQAQAARAALIKDMKDAGVNAGTARTDVDNYSHAVWLNGANSTQAQAAREKLITDLLDTSGNAKKAMSGLSDYTTAIKDNGVKSDAAKAARAKLVADLTNAGVKAPVAQKAVANYTNAVTQNGRQLQPGPGRPAAARQDILNASGARKPAKPTLTT